MLTIAPNETSANVFLETLNHCHSSVKFTIAMENNGMLLFLGTQLLNKSAYIETKVCVKPTNTGLFSDHKIMLKTTWPGKNYLRSCISAFFHLVLILLTV